MNWPRLVLSDLLTLEYGKPLKASDRDPGGEFPVAGSNGPDGLHSQALVAGPGIVVGRKGSAGKVVWYEGDFWPIDTTYYVVARLNVDLKWVYYLLRSLNLERLAATTGVPGLNRNDAYALEARCPPKSEQRRTVEILDQADGLRRLRAEADAKAERILPALFIKMFGDPANSWEVHRLGSLLRKNTGALQSGPFGTHLHNSDFVGEGTVLAVGIDNVLDGEFVLGRNRRITNEKYEELKKYTLEAGDVLITIMGTVGRSCVFPGVSSPAICTKHVYRIQVDDRVHPEYLSAALRFSSPLRAQLSASTTGQIVAGTTSTDLRSLQIAVSPRSLQDAFAKQKGDLDTHRGHSRRVAERLEVLFRRLLGDAFSGDLTSSWREAHMKELLGEMEQQATTLREIR